MVRFFLFGIQVLRLSVKQYKMNRRYVISECSARIFLLSKGPVCVLLIYLRSIVLFDKGVSVVLTQFAYVLLSSYSPEQ